MSNISRRKFLKGAGAAALAVAAAGVLAGCSKNDVIDAVATEEISVVFKEEDGALNYVGTIKVKKGDKVSTKDVEDLLPHGLLIPEENDDLPVDWEKKEVVIDVCEATTVPFQFIDSTSGEQVGNYAYVDVPKTKTSFTKAELAKYGVEAPAGYEIMDVPAKLEDGVVKVGVYQ